MRWARFEQNGSPTYGVVEGDRIIPVRGSPFEAWERTSTKLPLSEVKLLVPVVPPTFYAAGLNYAEHVKEAAEKLGLAVSLPTQADIGYRANNALIANGDNIVIPSDATDAVQYEGELVVVIGRQCKNLTRENALSAVMGYTVGNDVSERTWQKADRTLWRAKNTDTFKPMGPWIETDVDLGAMETTVRLNDREVSRFRTADMIFGIAEYISAMSRYLTLYPGDVIWMGTDDPTLDMKAGDVVEVGITGIGSLRNPVAGEA